MTSRSGSRNGFKKESMFPAVIAFGIGPMLSSGVFLLPGMVYGKAGTAGILAYIVAGLLVLPSLLSKAELATAMPRAGGTYYFLDRSMGPLIGSVSGFGTWLALIFKSGFELIGLGAYLVIFFHLPVKPVAMALVVVFGVLNILGVKNHRKVQASMVSIVLGILTYFIITGLFQVESTNYTPFLMEGSDSFLTAVGIIFVGFAGLTTMISPGRGTDNPEHTFPMSMVLALLLSVLSFVLVMLVLIGTVPPDILKDTLTPLTDSASQFLGETGRFLLAGAAVIAFVASANVGITAASRYPLVMSRDKLMSDIFKKTGRFHTHTLSILATLGLLMLIIIFLSPEGIAKIASAFQLMIFGLINLAVVAMRESKIESYDPSYKSAFYPWLQIIGILAPIIIIPFLGLIPMVFSGGIIIFGTLWYFFYAHKRVKRAGALARVFQRIGETTSPMLDRELRQILKEKGLRKEDSFEESILTSTILYHAPDESFDDMLKKSSSALAKQLGIESETIYRELRASNQVGDTPVGEHLALPHARMDSINEHGLVIVQSKTGIQIGETAEPVHALFILISPADDPAQHLRFLAEFANRSEGIDFSGEWRNLTDDDAIRNLFIRSGKVSEILVRETSLAGKRIRDMQMHSSCLVALIRRGDQTIIPHGDTVLQKMDILTVVGEESAVDEMNERYR